MAWEVTPVAVGQAYLVGEEDDFVLVHTLSSDKGSELWCTFHNTGDCNHTAMIVDHRGQRFAE